MFRSRRRALFLPRFFLGRPFGRWKSLETLVRNRLAALDRAAVGTCGETGLGALDGSQLFAEVVRETLFELVLIELGGLVGRIYLVRRLGGVLGPESRERPLDPLSLSSQEFASPFCIHHATLSNEDRPTRRPERPAA